MAVSTKVDRSKLNWLLKQIALLKYAHCLVGIFSPEIAAYAIINEYGTKPGTKPKIPERSVFRATITANRKKYTSVLREGVGKLITQDTTAEKILIKLGSIVETDIKNAMTDIRTPMNADSTIERKGFDNPWIETGAARNSVTTKVFT